MPQLSAGRLRHRIILQEPVETQDTNTGDMVPVWTFVANLWAAIEPLSAREFIAAQAEANKVSGKITIRYRKNIHARMRMLHRSGGVYYNIEGILADNNSGLEYMTVMVSEGLKYTDDAIIGC